MRKIKTIDDITKDGKVEFGEGYEFVGTAEEADAILMRSTDLHGYELPEGIRAIARCGAGVNNIPIEEYAKKGAAKIGTEWRVTLMPKMLTNGKWCKRRAAQ